MKAQTQATVELSSVKRFIELYEPDERQRRGLYGLFASEMGYGGVAAVARQLDVSPITVKKGQSEFLELSRGKENESADGCTEEQTPASEEKRRIRKPGGGRKSAAEKQPGLLPALKALLEETTYGDPQRVLCWTTLSLRKIEERLAKQGLKVSRTVLGEMLERLGYSKQVNQKMLQVSAPHPDRDKQFRFINEKSKQFLAAGLPVISIDSKKKEGAHRKFQESGC